MRGDDNISVVFKFFIIIYVGDGLEVGFNFVWVSFKKIVDILKIIINNY